MDLDKLLADYKGAYLSYPQVRRDVEFKLMAALVDEVKALKTPVGNMMPAIPSKSELASIAAELGDIARKRGPGRPPKVEDAA